MATIRLGDITPDFTTETTQGTIQFHDQLGDSWELLFHILVPHGLLLLN
jgi:alkyl hydroperoxide reductase subunit AhpC